jgi:hypothetical protein
MEDGTSIYKNVSSDFFRTLIAKILYFYESREIDFVADETLAVMKLREALLNAAEAQPGTWISL